MLNGSRPLWLRIQENWSWMASHKKGGKPLSLVWRDLQGVPGVWEMGQLSTQRNHHALTPHKKEQVSADPEHQFIVNPLITFL